MNAITPQRPVAPALSDALAHLVTAPGLTLTWRPSATTTATRIALARLLLAGTGHDVQETPR